jgi:energy-coupling factor transporter ATP-binding protein EcfA2
VVAVSGALERRCYTITAESTIYPNLFVLLVGPPGVGKSKAIDLVQELWATTGELNVAPSTITKAGLIDALQEGFRQTTTPVYNLYHSLLVASSEFGNLVPAHDLAFLNTLNELYDCRNVFEERTRGGGKLKIDKPHLCLVGGTQPKFLGDLLPESAFGMGFTSRLIFVYAAERTKVSLFGARSEKKQMRRELEHDLNRIVKLAGEFQWTDEAARQIESWHQEGCPPEPTHPKLQNYNPRRIAHAIKLSMVMAADENSEMLIQPHHFHEARSLLLETEHYIPEIFREISASGSQSQEIEEAFEFLWHRYAKTNRPIRESALTHFLSQRVPTYQIENIINTMLASNMISEEKQGDGKADYPGKPRLFVPREKYRHGEE